MLAPLHHRSLWAFVHHSHIRIIVKAGLGFYVLLVAEMLACPVALVIAPDTDIGFCGGGELKWFIALFTIAACVLLAALPYWYINVAKPHIQELAFDPAGTIQRDASGSFAAVTQHMRERRDQTVYLGLFVVALLAVGLYGFKAAWPADSGYDWTPPFVPKKPCKPILAAARFASVASVVSLFVISTSMVIYFNYLQWRRSRPDRDLARSIEF
jgi:hypothetical protein